MILRTCTRMVCRVGSSSRLATISRPIWLMACSSASRNCKLAAIWFRLPASTPISSFDSTSAWRFNSPCPMRCTWALRRSSGPITVASMLRRNCSRTKPPLTTISTCKPNSFSSKLPGWSAAARALARVYEM